MLGHASPDLPPNWTASEFARFETYMASTEPFWQPDYGLTWDEGELTQLEMLASAQAPSTGFQMAMTMNGHAPSVGVSAAHRAAREQLTEAVSVLMTAEPGDYAEVLDDAAYKIGALVGHGFLDRSDAADALTRACVASGFTAEAGPDVVQEAISAGFVAGGRAAKADIEAAERTPEGEESHSDVAQNSDFTPCRSYSATSFRHPYSQLKSSDPLQAGCRK